jgi:hypothetical protein
MTQDVQALDLARLCRARGLPQAPEKKVAERLELAPALRRHLVGHLARARTGIDDHEALAWLRDFIVIAQWDAEEQRPDTRFAELNQLVDLVHAANVAKPTKEQGSVHENLHFFGKRTAITVELDRLRADRRGSEWFTLAFEATEASAGTRSYDWSRKIVVQLGRKELPECAAAMLGLVESWSTDHHGPGHDKHLTIRNQPGGLQVLVRQGTRALSVPVAAGDCYLLSSLALKALMLNDPHLTSDTVVSLCKRVARHASNNEHAT